MQILKNPRYNRIIDRILRRTRREIALELGYGVNILMLVLALYIGCAFTKSPVYALSYSEFILFKHDDGTLGSYT